jgi:hypothetical protein
VKVKPLAVLVDEENVGAGAAAADDGEIPRGIRPAQNNKVTEKRQKF